MTISEGVLKIIISVLGRNNTYSRFVCDSFRGNFKKKVEIKYLVNSDLKIIKMFEIKLIEVIYSGILVINLREHAS